MADLPEWAKPPAILQGHGKHIRQGANATVAELLALTEQERAHLLIDVCRALLAGDPRVDMDPE